MSSQAKSLLEEAAKLVSEDRQASYGDPLKNHQGIANLWNAYLANEALKHGRGEFMTLHPEDVAILMTLLKISRIQNGNHKDDNYIDGAAYLAIAGDIASRCLG